MNALPVDLRPLAGYALLCLGASLVTGALLLAGLQRRLQAMQVPADATFTTTLRHVPFLLVVALDLLDFALDIFAAPIVWVLLDRLGLRALRNVSAVEALIPFTQPIPTLTLCWLAVNVLGLHLG